MTAFNQASGSAKVEAALAAMSCQCATPVAGCAGVADGEHCTEMMSANRKTG
jgi:hypothetical protein